ncbi:PQQ-binding-like beta-propeller repeat protein [Candidatus Woesearchaeota archaeon]|nr:PQQ-binding-like beta-propeller repeat protein [Candidatus Woesearchaeota archaeon]
MAATIAPFEKVWKIDTEQYRHLNYHDILGDVKNLALVEPSNGLEILCAILSDNTRVGINPEDGSVIWTNYDQVFDSHKQFKEFHAFPYSEDEGLLYLLARQENEILEVDAETGQIRRRIDLKRELGTAWVNGSTLFGAYDENHLIGYDRNTGEQRWQREFSSKVRILGHDENGNLYVSVKKMDDLLVLDPKTGKTIRTYDPGTTATSLAIGDSELYLTLWDENGSVVSLSRETGKQNWKVEKNTNRVIRDGSQLFLLTRDLRKVLSLDATTGKLLWRHEKLGDPTINDYDVTDGHVIVGYSSGSLGIHNRETGDPENLFPMDHGSVNIVTASGTGKVYVADKREIALYAPRK